MAWQVNPFILDVALQLHAMGRTVGALVTEASRPDLPERPLDADTNESDHKAWCRAKATIDRHRGGSSVLRIVFHFKSRLENGLSLTQPVRLLPANDPLLFGQGDPMSGIVLSVERGELGPTLPTQCPLEDTGDCHKVIRLADLAETSSCSTLCIAQAWVLSGSRDDAGREGKNRSSETKVARYRFNVPFARFPMWNADHSSKRPIMDRDLGEEELLLCDMGRPACWRREGRAFPRSRPLQVLPRLLRPKPDRPFRRRQWSAYGKVQ